LPEKTVSAAQEDYRRSVARPPALPVALAKVRAGRAATPAIDAVTVPSAEARRFAFWLRADYPLLIDSLFLFWRIIRSSVSCYLRDT
jgi:hypothetical protein